MTRLDRKRGRFTVNEDTNEINSALEDWQGIIGTIVVYYRFNAAASVVHPVYNEGYGAGKAYHPPYRLPVLHATHLEGENQRLPEGFYFNDDLHCTASFAQLGRIGLTRMDIDTANYLTDRMIYDNKVFRVTNIQILGQIQDRDIIVGIDGTQVKPDELVNDQQFAQYSA